MSIESNKVDVVFCKDCKYSVSVRAGLQCSAHGISRFLVRDNDYCSFGIDSSHTCKCYEERTEKIPRYSPITGKIDHYIEIKYGVCLGTMEVDRCNCGGNKNNCENS